MLAAPRSRSLVAAMIVAALGTACASSSLERQRANCVAAFQACAPPAPFDETADLSKVSERSLVQVAARLDVSEKLASDAVVRLKTIVNAAAEPELFEIDRAVGETASALEKCGCGGQLKSQLFVQGVPDLVRERLPAREKRSPDLFAERIFTAIGAIRELRRSSAAILAGEGGDDAKVAGGEDRMREAEQRLCRAVQNARAALPEQGFATALDVVNHKEVREAGEGSAAAARQRIEDAQAAESCGDEQASGAR